VLDKRDELIAWLGKSLGLVSDTALARATELKKRFPGKPLEQLLDESGFLTKENKAKLAAAFNQKIREGQGQGQRGAAPAAKVPARPGKPQARADDSGVIVPDAEDADMLARAVDPLATPPSEDTLGSDEDLTEAEEAELLAEPTIMMQDEDLKPKARARPPEPKPAPRPQPRPAPSQRAPRPEPKPLPPSEEDEILSEPTIMVPDEELAAPPSRPAPARGRAPPPRPAQQPAPPSEEEILSEPTIMVPDEEMSAPAPPAKKGSGQRPPLPEQGEEEILSEPTLMVPDDELALLPEEPETQPLAEEAILAEPTLMLPEEDLRTAPRGRPPARPGAPGSGRSPAPRPTKKTPSPEDEAALLAEPTIVLPGAKEPEAPLDLLPEEPSGEVAIPEDLTAGGVPAEPASSGPPQPGVKKRSGKLDRREFERRSKLRMGFEGMTLGDYLIEGELSRGAFGVVLKVRPESQAKLLMKERGFSGELMAMKVMLETHDPEETRRFMDEVKVLIGLVHPNIIRIFDAGVENGLKYYTMELINGVDSRTLVREQGGKLPVLYAMRITKDVAGALASVHAKTIYHRDMKPANVMIDRGSQPYRTVLIDFGLVTKKTLNKADEGLVLGTPSYMPPEQAKPKGGFGEVNATSDVYSLGATFYFLMTGQAPFPGKDPREIIKRVCSEPPPDPITLNAEIPKTIAALCMKCLAKPQRDRFTSAKLLEKELEKELASAQLKLKAKGFMRKIFGSGGSGRQPPPTT
jgi:hypothetical protein